MSAASVPQQRADVVEDDSTVCAGVWDRECQDEFLRLSIRAGRTALVLSSCLYAFLTVCCINVATGYDFPVRALSAMGVPAEQPRSSSLYNCGICVMSCGLVMHNTAVHALLRVRLRAGGEDKGHSLRGWRSGVWRVIAWLLPLDPIGLLVSGIANESYGRVHTHAVYVTIGLSRPGHGGTLQRRPNQDHLPIPPPGHCLCGCPTLGLRHHGAGGGGHADSGAYVCGVGGSGG
ncbi:hypothetical protein KIPB_004916 [Kipferlia bialata]|uniref:Uncharacterized protein n=1 Tax=Kipferlia bialata TaxID=797122 RepID=A0A9K3CVU3_9EUKA|nr:hypothetical protein KIPB_004916 [Kipferlia bialata]|eukprot:g4916.t1